MAKNAKEETRQQKKPPQKPMKSQFSEQFTDGNRRGGYMPPGHFVNKMPLP